MKREEIDEIKHHFDAAATESRRHFDPTAEHLSDQISAVAEGHAVVDGRLDRMERAQLDLSGKVDKLEVGASVLSTRMENVETTIAGLASTVQRVDQNVASLSSRFERVEGGLTTFRADVKHEFAELRAVV